ncbi:TPA: hypothetical protein ACK3Q6_008063 [Burkholderia cepacia]
MKITVALLIRALIQFVVALSFMVVIFSATGVPIRPNPHGLVDVLLTSWESRYFAALVMTGVFCWVFCLDAQPFWNRFAILRSVDEKSAGL